MNKDVALECLQKIYPDYDFRPGYIGNCERWGDDRSHRIWVNDIYETLWDGHKQPISIKLGDTEQLNARTPHGWTLLLMRAVQYIERMTQKELTQ